MPDTANTADNFNGYRLITQNGRTGLHRVAIDYSGAVIDWEREPITLNFDGGGAWARIQIGEVMTSAIMSSTFSEPLVLHDGKLHDIADYGGEDAEKVQEAVAA